MSDNKINLCCFGAGGHGTCVAGQWQARNSGLVVFADQALPIGSARGGIEIRFSSLDGFPDIPLLITIGDNGARANAQNTAMQRGLRLTSFVASPEQYFADAPGAGSVVLAGAVVNPGAQLAQGVIVNSGAVVEHDCTLEEFVHISPNATLAGGVHIGAYSWIGAGAIVLPGLSIAPNCIVGAGAVVTSSILQAGTYVGAPARRLE